MLWMVLTIPIWFTVHALGATPEKLRPIQIPDRCRNQIRQLVEVPATATREVLFGGKWADGVIESAIKYDLLPYDPIEVPGGTITLGKPITSGGRYIVHALVSVGDKTYYRLFLRSRTHNIWTTVAGLTADNVSYKHLVPRTLEPWEEACILPAPVQIRLAKKVHAREIVDGDLIPDDDGEYVLQHVVSTLIGKADVLNLIDIFGVSMNKMADKTIAFRDPSRLKIQAAGDQPDFSKLVTSYEEDEFYAGKVKVFVYLSNDGKSTFFYKMQIGSNRVSTPAILDNHSTITPFGVPSVALQNESGLTVPLYERARYIPAAFRGVPLESKPEIVDTWPYQKLLPHIRDFYVAHGIAIP